MESPEFWRWIWLVGIVAFMAGELLTAGSFFMMPFVVGAFVAFLMALTGFNLPLELTGFILGSGAAFLAMRPLARRLDQLDSGDGIGAKRLVGAKAVVTKDIPGGTHLGMIKVGGELWRAESLDDHPIPAGAQVSVVEVRGTRAVVWTRDQVDRTETPNREPGWS